MISISRREEPQPSPRWRPRSRHLSSPIRENVKVGLSFDEHPGGFGTREVWSGAIKHSPPLILCSEDS